MLSSTNQKRFAKCKCSADYEHLTVKTKKLEKDKYLATITCDVCGESISVYGYSTADAVSQLVKEWSDNRFKPLNEKQKDVLDTQKASLSSDKEYQCKCGCKDITCYFSKKGAGMFLATATCTSCGRVAYGNGRTRKEAQKNAYENIQKADDCPTEIKNSDLNFKKVEIMSTTPDMATNIKEDVLYLLPDSDLSTSPETYSQKAIVEFCSKHLTKTNELIQKGQEELQNQVELMKTQNLILNSMIKKMTEIQCSLLELLRLEKATIEGVEIAPSFSGRQP